MENIAPKPASLIKVDASFSTISEAIAYGWLTPARVASAYDVPHSTGEGIKVGIISFGGGFLQSDLDASMADIGLPSPNINYISVDGSTNDFNGNLLTDQGWSSVENTLDIYCVASVVPDATINVYGTSFLTDAIDMAVDDGCDVISISWLYTEAYGDFAKYSFEYAASNNIPIVVSTGDYGSAFQDLSAKGIGYPASSDKVIAVGGTHLRLDNSGGIISESVEHDGYVGGGGGISTIVKVPSWQNNLTYTTYPGLVTRTLTANTLSSNPLIGRGSPDVALPMNSYAFYFNGIIRGIGGTSAAAPVMAGILARLKNLSNMSMSSEEYNQIFYSNISTFNDINLGNDATYFSSGYIATANWDPVVGLGSPNGRKTHRLLWLTGNIYPVVANKNRPSSGVSYPRPKIRR